MPLRYHARRRRAEPPSPAAPHRPPAHELDWADVAQLPLCLLSRDMQNRQTLDKVFAATGATPNVVLQANAIRVLLQSIPYDNRDMKKVGNIDPLIVGQRPRCGDIFSAHLDLADVVYQHRLPQKRPVVRFDI